MSKVSIVFMIFRLENTDSQESKHSDGTETVLEQRVQQWFTAEEQTSRPQPLIIRELGGLRYKVLVITSLRAILFEVAPFRKLQDISDKSWRQFVSVHLAQGYSFSTLELHFFRYHDSLFYHNPYKDTSPYMEETDFKIVPWRLERLNKEDAATIYGVLKEKELHWKEERRKEHFEQIGSLNTKPPGGAPPKKN